MLYGPYCERFPTHCFTELRRHKQSFIKMVTKNESSRLQDATAAKRLFVDYLNQRITAS